MSIQICTAGKKLIFLGAVLFLIGLFQGALIHYFLNTRMALSAHLAAVQNGMALMIFGLIWQLLILKGIWLKTAFYSTVASMYMIWVSITISAIFGASNALPQAGKGFSATQLIENSVSVIIYTGSGLAILSGILIVLGLYRSLDESHA